MTKNHGGFPDGLVRIHPTIEFSAPDPRTGKMLKATDWSMPGMWALAKLDPGDGTPGYWVDLPYSLAVLAPSYLDIATSEYFSDITVPWYGARLQAQWGYRVDLPMEMKVVKNRETRKPVLLNCLYPWHGDAVSLLLRAKPLADLGLDVIVIIGPSLQRLVPKYVAEAWIIQPNGDTSVWNFGIDRRIKQEVARFDECYVPRSFKPCLLSQGELAEVTGIAPFPRDKWGDTLLEKPVVTFILREDRVWGIRKPGLLESCCRGPLRRYREGRELKRLAEEAKDQERHIIELADALRKISPDLEFAVCGSKGASQFPPFIKDLRAEKMSRQVNEDWDQQCARSHVVIAVHGSHTMPHNGFGGSFIELVPFDKWANLLNTTFVTTKDPRETLFCYRFLPQSISPFEMTRVVLSIVYNYMSVRFAYHQDYPDPISDAHYALIGQEQKKRFAAIRKCAKAIFDYLVLAP